MEALPDCDLEDMLQGLSGIHSEDDEAGYEQYDDVESDVEDEEEQNEDNDSIISEGETFSTTQQLKFGTFLPNCSQIQSCGNCETTRAKTVPLKTNYALSKNSLQMDLRNSNGFLCACQVDCKRDCMRNLPYMTMAKYRVEFWGKIPNSDERWNKFVEAIKSARQLFAERIVNGTANASDYSTPMIFLADKHEMCEQAYCNMLGVATSQGYKSSLWKKAVSFCNGVNESRKPSLKYLKKDSRAAKKEHAFAYQLKVIESLVVDFTAKANFDNYIYLPYASITAYYGEYEYICKSVEEPLRASYTTFVRAFKDLKVKKEKEKGIKIRLSGGSGSFDKCDICHNADNLLKASNNWSPAETEIIKAYRRQHITQQFDERIKLQNNIHETHTLDHNGQPIKALVFGDGMTVYTGNTPRQKVGNRGSKGNTHCITSRVIGVEVHCGPVHGTILYYTDDMTKGGSSTIIEVTRQALLDLQQLLSEKTDKHCNPLDMPRELILQFDNCPENKNRFVFSWVSLLVEEDIFDKIEIYFLIVGHTHASIDQYFSVLANQIHKCDFIGSPLALEFLFSTIDNKDCNPTGKSWVRSCNRKLKSVPLGVYKLCCVFDTKTAILPLINTHIKFYSIPHCFLFQKFCGIAVMQYSIFSSGDWLPKRPDQSSELNISDQLSIKLQHFDLVGGEDKLLIECGVNNENVQTSVLSNQHKKAVEVLATLNDLSHQLRSLEINVCKSSITHTTYFEELIEDSNIAQKVVTAHRDELHNEIVHHLLNQNTAERGFIAWLKPNVSRSLDPEPLNLMPALKYLIDHEEYESTGYDVFDIFDEELDVQYMKIMTLLTTKHLILDRKKCILSLPSYIKLRTSYWKHERHSSKNIDCTKFVNSTNEIVNTAKMVIQDVIEKRIKTSSSTDFNFQRYVLSKQEIVFYFHRLTIRGICLTLMEEFSKILTSDKYSVLPLIRPTASNQEAAQRLAQNGEEVLSSHNELVFNLLKRPADKPTSTAEVVSRDGLDKTTLDDQGQLALCRPTKQAKTTLENAVGGDGKSKQSIDCSALKKLKKQDLVAIAVRENVTTAKTIPTKDDYINAILMSRYGILEGTDTGENGTGAGTGGITPAASTIVIPTEEVVEAEKNVTSGICAGGSPLTASSVDFSSVQLKILMASSRNVLATIAEKEKVELLKAKSRMSKKDYAAAIYIARSQK